MNEGLSAASWVLEHGVSGVLIAVCAAEAYAIRHLWKFSNECQQSRIDDLMAYTEKADSLHDKVYKTANDMEKAIEVIRDRRMVR